MEESDLLVCAPTGAGKTWVAIEAIELWFKRGGKSWYASPLKALSNAKYEELRGRFGDEVVGILTGDRKENADAPIVVGTTEILRNHLYDAMDRGEDVELDLVVMDEAHYLNDPGRGVVWEEVLIYLPSRVRLLLLSATIGNPKRICGWLEGIRGEPFQLVEERDRPVPLYSLFLHPEGQIGFLSGSHGLLKSVRRSLQQTLRGPHHGKNGWQHEEIIEGLRELGLLPAIFFLKSRADCDRAVESFFRYSRAVNEQEKLLEVLESFTEEHSQLREHRHYGSLIRHGVAAHHAGQLPHWKLLIERLMNAGYLDVIFSTSTVAAGVDFPARTVVLLQSDRFNGQSFAPLSATELQQMTGRAGRRGKDRVGFALFVPGRYQDVPRVARMLEARPEGIRSQIQINFSMVLNLLLSHRPGEIRPLLQRSLAAYQSPAANQGSEENEESTEGVRPEGAYPESAGGRRRATARRGQVGDRQRILHGLRPGRLFLRRDGSVHVAFDMGERRGKPICLAHRVDRRVRVRKGRLVLKGVPLGEIDSLLERQVKLPPVEDVQGVKRDLKVLQRSLTDLTALSQEPPPTEQDADLMATPFLRASKMSWLWKDFLRHLHFLREIGFVDEEERLTPDGRWASRLRLDHPILVAEAIRREVFRRRSAPVVAGLIAPFVTDREREVFILDKELDEIGEAFDLLLTSIYGILRAMEKREFPTPKLQFWPAAILYLWAGGLSWAELLRTAALDEGDLVSIIVRTGDHLRQVCDLTDAYPDVAKAAREALNLIQREPAYFW